MQGRPIIWEVVFHYSLTLWCVLQPFCCHSQAMGVETGWFSSWFLPRIINVCMDISGIRVTWFKHNILISSFVNFVHSQHVLGHHPYTNIDGADPDIVTASAVSISPVFSLPISLSPFLFFFCLSFSYTVYISCILSCRSHQTSEESSGTRNGSNDTSINMSMCQCCTALWVLIPERGRPGYVMDNHCGLV